MYKTLDRNELFEGFAVPDWATAAAYFNDSWYFEESLEQSDGCKFQRVGLDCRVCTYGEEELRGFETAVLFTPLIEQDDPLPPAPESVMYIGRQVQTRILRVKTFAVAPGGQVVDLHIGGGILGDGKSCSLDADAALQLAHDLNRMANEIKRKGKQNA